MGNEDLTDFPFLQTLKARGVRQEAWSRGEHRRPEGSTERALTFYLASRGRDLRHTQVGGGHNIIVGEAVPRARGRKGLSKGGIRRPQPTQGGNGRSYAPLEVPVFTLGMLWRPSNVWGKETGKKVLLKTPLGATQRISVPTAKLEVCGHSCRLKGRRPEAGGRSGSQTPGQGEQGSES